MDVFDLVATLTLDSSEYDDALGESEKKATSFGDAFGKVGKGVAIAGGVAGTAIAAVGAATVGLGKAMWDGASDLAEYGDNIDKMSQKMGMSIEAYQEWDAVMQHNGSSVESLKTGFRTLNKQIIDATEVISGISEAEMELETQLESGEISLDEYNEKYDELYAKGYENIDAFTKLGFSMQEVSDMAKSPEDAFSQIISKLQEMPEGAERTAIATELLGRSAMELGPLLNTSAEETQAMKDRVHELGGVMSDEAVKAAATFQDNLQDLQTAMSGVKRNIMEEVLPGLNTLMDGFTRLISGENNADEIIDNGIGQLVDGIENVAEKAITIATDIFPNLITTIAEKFPDLVEGILGLLQTIGPVILTALIDNVIPTILESLPMIAETALQLIIGLAEGLSSAIPVLIPTIIQVLLAIVDVILNNLPLLLQAAVAIITALADGILGNVDRIMLAWEKINMQIIATIISLIPQLIVAAFEIAFALISSLAEGILKMLTSDWYMDMLDAMIGSFTDIDWLEIGKNCIEGIANGFLNGITKIKDAAKNVVDSIKKVFTTDLEIHSPSKLFEYYGQMVDEGFAEGLSDGESMGIVKGMTETIKGSFDNTYIGDKYKAQSNSNEEKVINLYFGNELFRSVVLDAINTEIYISGGR